MFRKFDNEPNAEIEDTTSDIEMRRRAGHASGRPFTRSKYKPRLLFPNEEQRRAREAAEEADEEALTDIEMPQPSPTKKRDDDALLAPEADHEFEIVTPVKQQFHSPGTPPSTGRSTRSRTKNDSQQDMPMEDVHPAVEEPTTYHKKGKKQSPFASWSRTKPGVRAVRKGTKREGEPIEAEGSKRTRSGHYAAA
jgi:hypothetical protein